MTTIRVRNHYKVYPGQDLQFTDESAFLLASGGKTNSPALDNLGHVQVDSAADGVTVVAVDSDPAASSFRIHNAAGAVLAASVSGDKSNVEGVVLHGPSVIANEGEITTTSFGGYADAVVTRGGGAVAFTNSGSITALGHSSAFGVHLRGDVAIDNSGHINADAASKHVRYAAGVYVDGDASVVNTGTIEAHGAYYAQGVTVGGALESFQNDGKILVSTTQALHSENGWATGLAFAAPESDQQLRIVNTGLIKCMLDGHPGDAISERYYSAPVLVENSGKIIGSVSLYAGGNDEVDNAGAIDGNVMLGDGDDRFLETGRGAVSGDVLGYTGDDVLIGGGLADALYGDWHDYDLENGGDDSLSGGGGGDTLVCGTGQDTLVGGKGGDLLTGEEGADLFVYLKVSDSAGEAQDLITDLTNNDRIDLSAIDADSRQEGDQAFTLVASLDGHAGEASLAYDAGKDITTLTLDVNGDGTADAEIRFAGDHADFTNFAL